ncbi:hypothetical protein SDJN03_07474, partial [Cucurbita argyrosperma subsp. sororia]
MSRQVFGWDEMDQQKENYRPNVEWKERKETNKDYFEMIIDFSGCSRNQLQISMSRELRTIDIMTTKKEGYNIARVNETIPIRPECSLDNVYASFVNNDLIITFPKKTNV